MSEKLDVRPTREFIVTMLPPELDPVEAPYPPRCRILAEFLGALLRRMIERRAALREAAQENSMPFRHMLVRFFLENATESKAKWWAKECLAPSEPWPWDEPDPRKRHRQERSR